MEDLGTILRRIQVQATDANSPHDDLGRLDPPSCAMCCDRGFLTIGNVPITDPNHGKVIQCHCLINKREERMRKQVADLPESLRTASFASLDTSTIDLIEGRLIGVLLEGDAGLGKTHIAAAAVRTLRSRDEIARFVFVPDLMAELRRCVANNQSPDLLLDSYATIGFLVLDDFGRGRTIPTPFELDALTRLIQRRYEGNVPFMITTNLSFDRVLETYGQGVADRMWQASTADQSRSEHRHAGHRLLLFADLSVVSASCLQGRRSGSSL